MTDHHVLIGELLDDVALDLEQLAHACAVEPAWVVRQVQAGVLDIPADLPASEWRFGSGELRRARYLLRLERDFDAPEDIAALVVDLADEIGRLRARMNVLGCA